MLSMLLLCWLIRRTSHGSNGRELDRKARSVMDTTTDQYDCIFRCLPLTYLLVSLIFANTHP